MARANLAINSSIVEEFTRAQESRDIRVLKIQIVNEELVLSSVVRKNGTASEDFTNSIFSFDEKNGSLALFNINDESHGLQSWILIAWVPEDCRVRDKMLYASSREDIKVRLGASFFSTEYYANTLGDLTWQSYQQSLQKDFGVDILSEKEKLIREEKTLSQLESNITKSLALNAIPFTIEASLEDAFQSFKSNTCNWVAFTVDSEVFKLLETKTLAEGDSKIGGYINEDIASFILYNHTKPDNQKESIFLFSCPESIPIRMKMTMSSSKGTIISKLADLDLRFDRSVEIRGIDELDDVLKEDGGAASPATGSDLAKSTISKPQRPGKGRAKVGKFSAE